MLTWAVEFQTHEMRLEYNPAVNIIQNKMYNFLLWKSTYFRRACFSPICASDRIVRSLDKFSLCVIVDWKLSLSFLSQVTWPGTQPSSTRFPATPHQSGPSRGLLGSLGGRAHLELLVNKDPQVPQASQGMQVCREPQENEVSWATPLTECHEAEPNSGAYTMLTSEIMDLN